MYVVVDRICVCTINTFNDLYCVVIGKTCPVIRKPHGSRDTLIVVKYSNPVFEAHKIWLYPIRYLRGPNIPLRVRKIAGVCIAET